MDLFEQYEAEFLKKIGIIRERISALSNFSGERKKVAISETERLIEDAKKYYSRMEEQANQRRNIPQSKLRNYSSDLTRVQRDLEHATLLESSFQRRDDYLYDDYQVQEIDQRRRLVDNTQKIDDGTSRLHNAHRIAIETEDIGTGALTALHGQKDQLVRTRDNLGLIDDNMTRSRRILTSMSRRIVTNKIILLCIIGVLLLAIGLVVYFKWVAGLIPKKS